MIIWAPGQKLVDPRWIVELNLMPSRSDAAQDPIFPTVIQCLEGVPLALAVAGHPIGLRENMASRSSGQSCR